MKPDPTAPAKPRAAARPATTPRATREVQEAIIHVYEQVGGDQALIAWAKENPDVFYAMWLKLLPAQSKLEQHHALTLEEILAQSAAAEPKP